MKTKLFRLVILSVIGFFALGLVSCETTPNVGDAKPAAAGSADHKPSYDYWQNGGGACCPAHAAMFEGS